LVEVEILRVPIGIGAFRMTSFGRVSQVLLGGAWDFLFLGGEREGFTQRTQRRSTEGTEKERKNKNNAETRRTQRSAEKRIQGWEEEIRRRKIVRTRKKG
jgi:hypothetical protein